MERELKLVLRPPEYLRLASSLPSYAGERWLANHYFDTADHRLRRAGAMLRVRESDSGDAGADGRPIARRVLGLKQGRGLAAGQLEAVEHEEPIDEAEWRRVVRAGGDLGVLDHRIVQDAFALADTRVLPFLGTLRVLRKSFRPAPDAHLELDLVLFEDGAQDWELELESERVDTLRPWVADLLDRKGVPWREQTRTKVERFLAHPTREPLELCESLEGEVAMVGDGLVVRRTPLRGSGVFTTRPFGAGETLVEFEGAVVTGDFPAERGMRWVQVGPRSFLDVAGTVGRHVNHSCLPNAGVRGSRTLVALRPIAGGEEVVYDFAMTEERLEMVCCCGTAACRGLVTGYAGLPEGLRRRYAPFVSEYLKGRADAPGRPSRAPARGRTGGSAGGATGRPSGDDPAGETRPNAGSRPSTPASV